MTGRKALIAYSSSFASFLLDSEIGDKVNKIILFGSVARGDFTPESDIDLFIDTDKEIEKSAEKVLKLFRMSKIHEMWRLKGVKNEISIKVGKLEKWRLRRDVISTGIMLYGKYSEVPEKARYYLLVRMDLRKLKVAQQMRIWRRLYGYKQKIGQKVYSRPGLVEELGGKKLGKGVIILPMERSREIIGFLNKNRVRYTLDEIWSDTL